MLEIFDELPLDPIEQHYIGRMAESPIFHNPNRVYPGKYIDYKGGMDMKKLTLRPHPDKVFPDAYVYGEAVPVNIFIDGQKVEAPKAGIKVGRPMFPDTMGSTVGLAVGDYINDKEAATDGTQKN